MASQPPNRDFCLECRWEDFHIDVKDETVPRDQTRSQWDCLDQEHHTGLAPCEVDEACCDVEDCEDDCEEECQLDCGSVCDGFVDCDASTVCSVAHCDDTHCDGNHCESTDPACYEDHCCDGLEEQNCEFDSFFGLTTPLSLDTSGTLPSATMSQDIVGEAGKIPEHILPGVIDPCYHQDFLSSYQAHATHCDQSVPNHFECHDFQKDLQGIFPMQQLPTQTDVNPADVFHLLGTCPDFTVPNDQFTHDHTISGALPTLKSNTSDPLNFFHPHPEHHHVHGEHSHVHGHFKNPNDLNLNITGGPHRNHHRCRGHQHSHIHPYSPYSRQSRSSISSHFISSPGETPPPLDGGISSVLTTPDFSEENDIHMCKWKTNIHGVKTPCGATFTDAGALQDHLVSNHMNTVDGAKGNGYYCCWDGCHRPDEPFSQKSKLQGHFLTHSNYKNFRCSVCRKTFARQATLDRHERSHRGDKPYKCKDCGKMFTDSSELKTHSRTHTGEKPFKCTYPGCDFETGDSSNMSSHRLTHGERKHKCAYPGCTKSFTRPDQLKRHQRTTHKDPSSAFPSPSPDPFTLTSFTMV
ncbi:Zinc finger C2H2 [Penicillium verhagenii]|uniref:Zinc finger C2H2 n=1 Tax=Penicillium verhagenii TaxID=1562060 RepID=UPI002544FB46|nr:Zinc finger C2H2 [Penicillium verhagenii]KAJ5939551.1 Zinc finger C2H2 [Penicillium verhagenii]